MSAPSPKVLRFRSALELLCKEHDVMLIAGEYTVLLYDGDKEPGLTDSLPFEDWTSGATRERGY